MNRYVIGPSLPSWTLEEFFVPKPGPGEILVRMKALSLNYRELLMLKFRKGAAPRNFVPASDGAGEVVELGTGVTQWKVGDRVMSLFFPKWNDGPFPDRNSPALGGVVNGDVTDGVASEYVVFPEDAVIEVPAHLGWEEAATLPCAALTAWNALSFGESRKKILVQGTGGVSLFALQFAQAKKMDVFATTSRTERRSRLMSLGACEVYLRDQGQTFVESLLKNTNGMDHIIDVGGIASLPSATKMARENGLISVVGVISGTEGPFNIQDVIWKNLILRGVYVGSKSMFEDMNHFISQHRIVPIVDSVFPFLGAPKALEKLERGEQFGKIVLRF